MKQKLEYSPLGFECVSCTVGNKKEWLWITAFSTNQSSIIVYYAKLGYSSQNYIILKELQDA